MLIETEIFLEDAAGVALYTLKGQCYPPDHDAGIDTAYCDEYWLLLNGKEVDLELTEAQNDACYQRLLDAYNDRQLDPEE